ncbi:hypothetical protein KUCAC02_026386, partial [Chaenocephalus aceratus]
GLLPRWQPSQEETTRRASARLMASSACYTCSATRLPVTKPWLNMTALEPRVLKSKTNTGPPQWPG